MTKTSPAAQGTVAGWKLVPVEPTPEMRVAGRDMLRDLSVEQLCTSDAADTYRAMLSASPLAERCGTFTNRAHRIICEAAGRNQDDWSEFDHRLLDLAREADAMLSASPSPEALPASGVEAPMGWNSAAEWEIEQRAFHAAGREDVPKDVQELVAILWKQYCIAAEPSESLTSAPAPEDRIDG